MGHFRQIAILDCLPCTQMLKIGLVTRGSVERTQNVLRIPPVPHPAPTSGPVWPSDFLPIWAKMACPGVLQLPWPSPTIYQNKKASVVNPHFGAI